MSSAPVLFRQAERDIEVQERRSTPPDTVAPSSITVCRTLDKQAKVCHDGDAMNERVEMIGRGLLRTVVIGAFLPVAVSTESAAAASFCSKINRLIDEAPRDFSDIVVDPSRASGGHDVTIMLEGASDCAVRQLLNSKSYSCMWEFWYRDPRAYSTFEKLDQELRSCVDDRAVVSDDQNVNHPDFYDAQLFLLDRAKVAVSVKDKSAQESTFVFVSVVPMTGT
jgi:hypothetical protein